MKYSGGCHCGRVRFEVDAPGEVEAFECNCSICSKTAFLHLIVPKSRFVLLQGAEFLSSYTFNTGVARHLFCRICGVKSFYIPRSNPDGYSVNIRCLDPPGIAKVTVRSFDGRNWERHGGSLSHLSKVDISRTEVAEVAKEPQPRLK
ncbi:MAG TPA: GFA family protein [Candidatus Eisenbacteria bacterium]|nr:GFA family protein [Candidatus Eisenbacteria bacterium]